MMLCIGCKHGHECPYFEGTDDMFHALLLYEDKEIGVLKGQIEGLFELLKARVKEEYRVSKGFSFCIDLGSCEGYEPSYKVDWSDDDFKRLHALTLELYTLAGECRSKVGVRIPFRLFDVVVDVLERYLNVVESGKVRSNN